MHSLLENYSKHSQCRNDHTENNEEFVITDRSCVFISFFFGFKKVFYQPKYKRFSKLWICIHFILLLFNNNIKGRYYLGFINSLRNY